jgi:hypothetical protein
LILTLSNYTFSLGLYDRNSSDYMDDLRDLRLSRKAYI